MEQNMEFYVENFNLDFLPGCQARDGPTVTHAPLVTPGTNQTHIESLVTSDEIDQLLSMPKVDEASVNNVSAYSDKDWMELFQGCLLPSNRGNSPTEQPIDQVPSTQSNLDTKSGGPVQLWQFLLQLLTDHRYKNIIRWTGDEFEFQLSDPDEVARLWGIHKNKPQMNYEKLSRGLRYYYDKNVIKKTSGKKYVYRFVCDIHSLI
ncbi:hypothetical protein CHS0354_008425 [Potamilus streckersoni]|uniref:ETS domain-containing protein n=1 Tax=Potamilus streckersoni TaxID=2493646 RepID=A0AAE0RPL8_9BIVA|nr:hypothetical protein CHS0354_008425 [Potamilus streckersoni]